MKKTKEEEGEEEKEEYKGVKSPNTPSCQEHTDELPPPVCYWKGL